MLSKRYKQNTIFDDLHRAKRISTKFDTDVSYIIDKFQKADKPIRFINNIVNDFIKINKRLRKVVY